MNGGGEASGSIRQASLRRLNQFEIRPNRDLGQNFLTDDNILRLIESHAGLAAKDVVLEIGGGLGVLSEFLAERVAHVHVVEIDRRLEPAMADAIAPFDNVTLHIGDAIGMDFATLEPSPTKLIANLPYGIAATAVLKALEELPGMTTICVMTQLEVARRMAAEPGSKLYGITSVLTQLACRKTNLRKLSRQIFYPVPNVDSALVTFERIAESPSQDVRDLVHGAFAHRRKPIGNSIALKTGESTDRERVRAVLEEMGLKPDSRAEQLAPANFAALAERLRESRGDS